jgi:hypothetical protein
MFAFKLKRTQLWLLAGGISAFAMSVPVGPLQVREAEAIIGRPMTPGSVAGVARRTTRRTVAVGAAAVGTAAVVGTAAAASAYHHSLPYSDCYWASPYYDCRGTYYRPVQDGADTVYVIEEPAG